MALTPHPCVTIDGSSLGSPQSNQYEFEVNGTFNTMKLNRVGALLVDELNRNLRIQPYSGTGLNATATPTNRGAAEVSGRRSYRCDNALPRTDAAGNPNPGYGRGKRLGHRFTPEPWLTTVSPRTQKTISAGWRRDESVPPRWCIPFVETDPDDELLDRRVGIRYQGGSSGPS